MKADTKLPELPSEVLKKPSKDELHAKLDELDKLVEEQRLVADENRYKRRQVLDGGKVSDNANIREVMGDNIEQVKEFREQRKAHLTNLGNLRSELRVLETEKQKFQQNIPRNYHTERDLMDAIKQKEMRYQTTSSLTSQQERELLREIDILKKSIPDMKAMREIDPKIKTIRDQIRAIQDKLNIVKDLIDEKSAKISEVQASNDELRAQKDVVRVEADKFTELIDKAQLEISQCFKKKDELREEFYKNLYEFEVQSEQIRHIKRMMGEQRRLRTAGEER